MSRPPDAAEKGIRFGCGAIFGLVVGFFTVVKITRMDPAMTIAILAIVSLSLGLFAMRYGDRFWEAVRSWWWWS